MADGTDGTNNFSMSDALCGIVKFNGEDKTYSSSKWVQDIEDNAEIFQWSEQQTLIIARRSLTGTAALWLRSEKVFKSFEDLKTAVQREFPASFNIKEMHELMASRKKKRDESHYQYMLTMKELGKRAKFPDYVVIQYIVDGITDNEFNKSILYGVTSYSVLKEKLTVYEKMKAGTRNEVPAERPKKQQVSSFVRRCYNCGETNHMATGCPNGVKCFRCNNYGHMGSKCPGNSSVSGASASTPSVKQSYTSGPMERSRQQVPPSVKQFSSDKRQSAMFGLVTNQNTEDVKCVEMVSNGDIDGSYSNRCHPTPKMSNKPFKAVELCGISVDALIDSGSDVNLISVDLYDELKLSKCDDNTILSGLGFSRVRSHGKLCESVCIDGQRYDGIILHIVPKDSMPHRLILGQDFLQNVVMIMREGSVFFVAEDEEWLRRVNCCVSEVDVAGHIGNARVKEQVVQLVKQYKPVQTKEATVELKIILKDDIPVSQRPTRLSLAEQQTVEDPVEEWLSNKIIQEKDDELNAIRQCVARDGKYLDFWIDDGILYKGDQKQIVVPKAMAKEVIKRVHSNGRFAMKKMKETISQYDEERELLRQRAKEQIQKVQDENKKYYNKKRKPSSKYEIGDQVALKRRQFDPGLKLKAKFLGPYQVSKVKRNDRYGKDNE